MSLINQKKTIHNGSQYTRGSWDEYNNSRDRDEDSGIQRSGIKLNYLTLREYESRWEWGIGRDPVQIKAY